jgi:antitoxin VapB
MGAERHVRLFRNGRNRAVRIPREFDSFGDEVVMRQDGERLVIEPAARKRTWAQILDSLEDLEGSFPEIDDPPPEPVDFGR